MKKILTMISMIISARKIRSDQKCETGADGTGCGRCRTLFFSCYLMNLKPDDKLLENGSKERFKIMIQKNDQEELLGEKQRRERENEKGQILEGVIEKVEFPNKGLVYVVEERSNVLVKNGIPGQKIRFGINKFKHGRAEGRLLEVLERSPLETREPV